MSYAERTGVSAERSRAEIEELLNRYGADAFGSAREDRRAMIQFRCKERYVRFVVNLPDPNEKRFKTKVVRSRRVSMTDLQSRNAHDQEIRRMWRALALVVKAKLEAVQSGITTFEQEFMAHIVMPDNQTFAQHALPAIAEAYRSGQIPRLLPALPGAGETSGS
jgi:hypothetical protein